MAKSLQTNFSFRLADKSRPIVLGDSSIGSRITSENFYAKTYTVDTIGTYLGEIKEFLAIQCKAPVLIQFQREDMPEPNRVYCEALFINHGDFGKVWLRLPPGSAPVIVTVWYASDAVDVPLGDSISVKLPGRALKKLLLRNLDGVDLSLPLKVGENYLSISKTNGGIPAILHSGAVKSLQIQTT